MSDRKNWRTFSSVLAGAIVAACAGLAAADPYLLTTDSVTGKDLGDKPVVYVHEGREFGFVDQKSVDAFKADPAKYIAGVDKKVVEQQTPLYPMETCPISGEKLGAMGSAVNVVYQNRLVKFCCNMCPDEFRKDPAKTLKKLDEAVIAKQSDKYSATNCPVSGDKLGNMGQPVNVVVGNRLVKLCCPDCVAAFNKDPQNYLKKLETTVSK
jgi:YHS domain-containing protein